jgi:hypothetical protein
MDLYHLSELAIIMLSKINQSDKDENHMFSLICGNLEGGADMKVKGQVLRMNGMGTR